MPERDGSTWSLGVRLLHWLTVPLVAIEVGIAFVAMGGSGMATMLWFPFHASLGVVVAVVVLTRLICRAVAKNPWSGQRPNATRIAAQIVQFSLYLLLVSILVSGRIAYRTTPLVPPPNLFGWLSIAPVPFREWLPALPYKWLHRMLVWVFLAIAGAHVCVGIFYAIRRARPFDAIWFRKGR